MRNLFRGDVLEHVGWTVEEGRIQTVSLGFLSVYCFCGIGRIADAKAGIKCHPTSQVKTTRLEKMAKLPTK